MRLHWFIISSSLLGLSACQHATTLGPKVSPEEIATEKSIEDQAVAATKANGGTPLLWKRKPDERAQFERVAERVEKAGAEVCRDMGLPQKKRSCYYYMEMSTSPKLNAAADGKKVIIYTGMMHFVANDDELAAIIGHELTHNLMDHRGAKTANAMVGMVAGALMEGAAATQGINSQGEITQSAASLGTLAYSSEFEREADYVGLYIAARAGYNIHHAVDYWRRLSVQEPDSENGGLTHPSNPERFVAMQKIIEEIDFKRKHHLPLLPDMKPESR